MRAGWQSGGVFQKPNVPQQLAPVFCVQFLNVEDYVMHGDVAQIFAVQVRAAKISGADAKEIIRAYFIIF